MGLTRAFLSYMSKICLPLMRLPWLGGLLAQSAAFLRPFMWLFYNSLLPLEAGLYLILGFTFLPAHSLVVIISCHITLSFLL